MNINWDYCTSRLAALASDARTAAALGENLPGGASSAMISSLHDIADVLDSILDGISEENASGPLDSETEGGDRANGIREEPLERGHDPSHGCLHQGGGELASRQARKASKAKAQAFLRGRRRSWKRKHVRKR